MGCGNIKKVIAAAILVAFTLPSSLAISDTEVFEAQQQQRASMVLAGDIKLTESNEEITLSLRDSDVKQVLRMFADKAGLNIVFHDTVSGKVTLDLVKTSLNEAFDLVLQVTGLNYYRQGNTMIVMSKNSPDNALYSKQEMMVFPVKYVSASKIADFLNKNVFSMKKAGLSSVDAATVNSATNELIVFGMPSDEAIIRKVIEQFDKEPFTKTFAVSHTTPAEMANMICNLLLPSRGISGGEASGSGAGAGSSSFGGGFMTGGAADLPDMGGGSDSGIKLGEGIVACSISATSSAKAVSPFDVQNLSIAYFPQRGTITLMGGSPAQATMIENFIKANDIKQPQAFLEVSIVELNETGSKDFRNEWSFSSGDWSFNFDGIETSGGRHSGYFENYISGIKVHEQAGEPIIFIDEHGNQLQLGTTPPTQTETPWKFIAPRTTYITWRMNYLIQNKKARVLANPKILITNGQESMIDLTEDYVEKVTSEYLTSTSAGGYGAGTVQRSLTIGEDLGIKVSLTPFISPEGYVTVNIKPEYSTIIGTQNYNGNLEATLLSRRDLDLKNVRIKDGETLIIGGMIKEAEQKTVQKIPFLGDLPLVGPIFRSTSTSKAKNELVIMITPNIINDGDGTLADNI